jgi:hypothetical protein
MNFLEEFLIGHELKSLSHNVHAHLIHNTCLAQSEMIKNTKKSYLSWSQLMSSSFISHSQMTKSSASDYLTKYIYISKVGCFIYVVYMPTTAKPISVVLFLTIAHVIIICKH